MPEVTVYDHKGNPVTLEAVGNGLYEKLTHDEDGEIVHTGNLVNLKTALECDAYFSEERHERFLARKGKKCVAT